MPDFLVSAATGALSPVLHKLAALLSDEYKRLKGVRDGVKFLILELEAMHAFLLKKSEEENPDAQDKAWMKEVRELSYDIEDSLDEFMVRVDDDDSTKPDGFIDKWKKRLQQFHSGKTKARHRIAKEIEKLKGQVKDVSERHARYKQISNTVMNTSKVTVDPRALVIFEDASRLVGIDKPKQEVISFLMKDDGGVSLQKPKVVSIVGIGGIGKTTLANRVYQELKDQFHCRAFMSVSRNPDMVQILRTILSEVTGRAFYKTEESSVQQLVMKIREFLQSKRYFIVIDDVWDVETWDIIKYVFSSNSCGSVIITTTRIHDVAKACCSLFSDGWVYEPKPLEKQDSKTLFQNRIFGPRNECPENLKEVSDKILKKCGGSPLAIIAISGLLANKARHGVHSVTEWDQVQTSIGRGLEGDPTMEGMMGILSLSYFDLPHHLKACLLYLGTFPEDYPIEKKRLVHLWVGEGFIPAESTCTLYESGEKSFNELINRNLVLPVAVNQWTGEVGGCRLHDTILDFIVRKSTEDNFVAVHGIPRLTPPPGIKVRRLSLQGKTEGDWTLHSNQKYANVRSIISFGFPCSLLGVRFLRVLDFMACQTLGNHHIANIGELLQLRYLGLRLTQISELPEQIGALQYLETLDLRGCNVTQLPTSIVRLKRLVNLLLCPAKTSCFPSGIKNMQALEELPIIYIDIKAATIFVEEIGYLTEMRHLGILFFSNSGIIDEDGYVDLMKKMVSSFQRLKYIQTLDVQFINNIKGEAGHAAIFDGDDFILKVPWCSRSLRKLVLQMNPMSRLPSWIESLVNVEKLVLRIKKLDQESISLLGVLPVLVDLQLEMVNNVEGIQSIDKQRLLISNRYRSLRHFSVYTGAFCGPSIPMLTFEAGTVPKLEELDIGFDADITISVSNGRLDFGLNHLSQLTKVRCFISGTKRSILRVEAAIQKELHNHPKLPSFRIHHCPSTEDDVIVCTSGSDDHMSSSSIDDNHRQWLTAALALPTDLSFTIHHHGASPDLGCRHGQRPSRSRVRQGASIHKRESVHGALHIPDRVKGTSGAAPPTSDVLGSRLIAAPQQQEAFVKPCFTFSSGLPPNAEADYELSQPEDLANAFTTTFNGLSLRDDHLGSSATAVEAASSDMSGAAPAPSDVLGPPLIAAPQQQGAFVPPCFTFSSGSPPDAEAEEQATDCYKPSQHDSLLANAFNGVSLHNDQPGSISSKNQPGSSATAVEAASSDTGTKKNGPYGRRILVPRRRSSGRTAK